MASSPYPPEPGLIVLFGSGETSPTGRKVFDSIFRCLPHCPRLALLETPAGFELNSAQVIRRVGDFFAHRLQNYSPKVEVVPAKKRGTPFSPDQPEIVEPLLHSDLIFMGPGSPSYAVRQLRDSLAWYYLIARHRMGAVLVLASAATVAFSELALPVYEIYKVGEDVHWIEGLDFFKLYGLRLVFIPHWNNQEGGTQLDTRRCFMGQERFLRLMEMLPKEITIVGLDEKTALIMDPSKGTCRVMGLGSVSLIHPGHNHVIQEELAPFKFAENVTTIDETLAKVAEQPGSHIHQYHAGQVFPMSEMGQFHPYHPEASLPPAIWQEALDAGLNKNPQEPITPPEEILQLVNERDQARKTGNWRMADQLREKLFGLEWEITDTSDGPVIKKIPKTRR